MVYVSIGNVSNQDALGLFVQKHNVVFRLNLEKKNVKTIRGWTLHKTFDTSEDVSLNSKT